MEHFFPPNLSGDLLSDAHQSQTIGGEADVDHTQIIGGDAVKIFGGYIALSPPGFGTPAQGQRSRLQELVFSKNKTKKKFFKKIF